MIDTTAIIKNIAEYQPKLMPLTSQYAGVMVMFLSDAGNSIEIVLTKRAATLATYAGHFSLPGGMHDESDTDLYATAARELHEELGISPGGYEKIGQLNDFPDRYGNLVRPFVIMMKKSDFLAALVQSMDEIAEIHYLPISELPEIKADPELEIYTKRHPSYSYKKRNMYVWGLTAAILVHLWNVIST